MYSPISMSLEATKSTISPTTMSCTLYGVQVIRLYTKQAFSEHGNRLSSGGTDLGGYIAYGRKVEWESSLGLKA
jgi:hypothetical protein